MYLYESYTERWTRVPIQNPLPSTSIRVAISYSNLNPFILVLQNPAGSTDCQMLLSLL